MFSRHRIPLARRNLTHNWRRLAVALCGIGLAVVLMFAEMGFSNALFDSSVKILDEINADLILAGAAHNSLLSGETFDRQRVVQARGCTGVKNAWPLYIQLVGASWKGPDTMGHTVRVLACDVSQPILKIPAVSQNAAVLEMPGTALFDMLSRKDKYGLSDSPEAILRQSGHELNGCSIRVVGTFAMGTDFTADGNVILSERNLASLFPTRAAGGDPLSIVDLGAVQLSDPAQARAVQARLNEMLYPDVKVWTKRDFIAKERRFWDETTGIGFIFALGKWLGFSVGVIICYQIINADISDHIGEFATLKAMGYRNRYFVGLVMKEALYLSVLSFIPGLLVSMALYHGLARSTGLLMMLDVPRIALVFLLTGTMCVVSGGLAIRRVFAADPADLY